MLLPILLLPIFAGLFWFVVVLPQKRLNEQHDALVAGLAAGQRIITTGGLHGLIVAIDGGVAEVEVAPGVVVRVDTRAVAEVVDADVATATTDGRAGDGHEAAA